MRGTGGFRSHSLPVQNSSQLISILMCSLLELTDRNLPLASRRAWTSRVSPFAVSRPPPDHCTVDRMRSSRIGARIDAPRADSILPPAAATAARALSLGD